MDIAIYHLRCEIHYIELRIGSRWHTMPAMAEFLSPSLSPFLAELLSEWRVIVGAQKQRLFDTLFERYVTELMLGLDEMFYNSVRSPRDIGSSSIVVMNFFFVGYRQKFFQCRWRCST